MITQTDVWHKFYWAGLYAGGYVNPLFVSSHALKTIFNRRLMYPPAYMYSPAQHLEYDGIEGCYKTEKYRKNAEHFFFYYVTRKCSSLEENVSFLFYNSWTSFRKWNSNFKKSLYLCVQPLAGVTGVQSIHLGLEFNQCYSLTWLKNGKECIWRFGFLKCFEYDE